LDVGRPVTRTNTSESEFAISAFELSKTVGVLHHATTIISHCSSFFKFLGVGTTATNRPIVPAPGDYDGQFDGMMIGRGNRSTRRKPAPVPLCPPQIPHDLTWVRTRATAGLLHYLYCLLLFTIFTCTRTVY
jgi:hypothetical protein